MRDTASRAALHGALLLSGAAALVYQTSWTRMLHRVFGVGDLAVATVLAAFFLGLGLGSWLAARVAHRIERPARVYAILEVLVGAYAAASPWLVPVLGRVYVAVGADAGPTALSLWRLALALLVLVVPTLLMGMTLPVVARLTATREGWARGVTGLYATNTLGAVLGAAAGGLYLIPMHGGRTATCIAAAASFTAAALVWVPHRSLRLAPAEAEPTASAPARGSGRRALVALAFASMTGAAALAGEVLWTRVLRGVIHGTTQAFAAMLVNYLVGIALGALVARRLARSRLGSAWALGATQVLAALLTVLAMAIVPHATRALPLVQNELSFAPHEPLAILLYSGAILLPLALVLGTGLPLAWSLAEHVEGDAARGSGRLLAANTLGGLAGALLAGFVMVPALGIEASLFALVFLHLLTAALALRVAAAERAPALRTLAATAPIAAGVALLYAGPSLELPFLLHAWRRPVDAIVRGPDGSWREALAFLREGRTATVTVERGESGLSLFNDGRPESGIGRGEVAFGPELALLGGLPVLFAVRTDRALVIGLGAGHTTSVLLEGGFARVDVVELEEAVVDAARLLYEARGDPFPLDDPRAHLVVDDARNRLAFAAPRSYDAVVSQPSHPWLAGSSALYTREFFEEVDRALSDGGVFALWVNLFRIRPRQIRAVVRTLREVFPYVHGFVVERTSLVLAASRRPLAWDAELDARIERLRDRYFERHGFATRAALARTLELDTAAADVLARGAPLIVDDRPLLEFELASTPASAHVGPSDLDRILEDAPWWSADFARSWRGGALDAMLARIAHVVARPRALRRLERSLEHAGLGASERAMVEGALAEARGDVRGALAAWDRAATPEAAQRADALRLAEGMVEPALRAARERGVAPKSALPLLEAALLVDEEWALDTALEVAGRASDGGGALRDFVERYRARGCEGWREDDAALARRHRAVAVVGQKCAFAAGERERAEALGVLAVRGRRAAALAAHERGEACRAGGNRGCALRMFRRALREYPSQSAAAASLATLLHESGRTEEARDVLLRTLREVEGIPPSQARLVSAAERLGIDLGLELPARPGDSPSSTSTTVSEDMAATSED